MFLPVLLDSFCNRINLTCSSRLCNIYVKRKNSKNKYHVYVYVGMSRDTEDITSTKES